MDIPQTPFSLFVSRGGRVLGAAPSKPSDSRGFAPNAWTGQRAVMVVAVTVTPCPIEVWQAIVSECSTWEEAGQEATSRYGGLHWPYAGSDGPDGPLPYVHPVPAEA